MYIITTQPRFRPFGGLQRGELHVGSKAPGNALKQQLYTGSVAGLVAVVRRLGLCLYRELVPLWVPYE
jgi:hypothetical protein